MIRVPCEVAATSLSITTMVPERKGNRDRRSEIFPRSDRIRYARQKGLPCRLNLFYRRGGLTMYPMTIISLRILATLLVCSASFAAAQETVQVLVVDEKGDPVQDAKVTSRHLETVQQDGTTFHVPMQLASPETTDTNGRCTLTLTQSHWSLAGLHAFRTELTTDQVIELHEKAPEEAKAREEYLRKIDDRGRRFHSAYQILEPKREEQGPITLKMKKAVRVSGQLIVDSRPVAKAFVTIYSDKEPIDRLFPRSSPEHTDQEGRFSFYAFPGPLNHVQILVERPQAKYVLEKKEVACDSIAGGMVFELNAKASEFKKIDGQ